MRNRWIAVDFDGVLSSYSGWKGFDVLGEPNAHMIEAVKKFKQSGFSITIFTTRPATPVLIKWLEDNGVPYDSINSNGHNPPMTSIKPIYHLIIDDRALNYHGQGVDEVVAEAKKIIDKEF